MPTPPPRPALALAALGGLILGLLGAALMFVLRAWRSAHTECEFPGTEECAMELTMAHDLAQLQLYAGLGCALVSVGLLLALRSLSKKSS